jgi:ethanolamine utilization protein EutQ (cupin superfamily)
MSEPAVKLAPALAKYTVRNGPMEVELRSAPNGLQQLAGGFITFEEDGSTDPWRLPYEEVLFVVDGSLRLHVADTTVVVDAGEVVTIPRGATVVYEGAQGTRAFYALTPADWYKSHPHGL